MIQEDDDLLGLLGAAIRVLASEAHCDPVRALLWWRFTGRIPSAHEAPTSAEERRLCVKARIYLATHCRLWPDTSIVKDWPGDWFDQMVKAHSEDLATYK